MMINSPDSLNLKLPEIVGLYLDKLPLAEYQALSIAPKSIDSNWHLVYSAEKENCLRIMQHDCRCGFKNRRRKQLQ